jgi:carbon storage regulator CsrA
VLVLTRQPHQKIVLPSLGVTLEVVAVKGVAVRIGIEAPPDVQMLREELLDQSRAATGSGRNANNQLCPA